ncbi:hypothetical protein LLP99_17065 [Rouxiella badensis]|uniref:hypothetical protein n=1 Tax=Rouxiella badensis TaxID=1646377 RepID=UPI001D14E40E|nr:hypothetical protein [Rouxiella badensis]MCC3717961.1 hypothetical protein [Rouxiella badensis]MCC3730024.1 hypothetical protein [Rouxiella badensis]
MINKIAIILTAVIALIIALLMWVAFHYYGKSVTQAESLATAVQQKNEAEFITKSQALSVGIFNLIAGATLNDQKKNEAASQDRQLIIKTVLQKESCAVVNIPSAASDSLLDHYNAVRAGTGNANSVKPATAVPAVAATK